ncbi:hypothetical protein SM033_00147 [Vibrio phage vB_VpaM_sm033]|nr:hypothetical protein SM033_00147 [Vibrio phage vB_VpaM_sm033]
MIRPEIDATGVWRLEAPYTIDESAVYRCEAINGFNSLEAQGVNVYERYYLPVGLDESTYLNDKLNNIDIVTLMAEGYDTVFVPTTYILEAPGADIVDYRQFFLGVKIGLLPATTSMVELEAAIKDIVKARLGVTPDIRPVVHPVTQTVTLAEHDQIEAARLAALDITPSFEQRYIEEVEKNARLSERINLYEGEIVRLKDLLS